VAVTLGQALRRVLSGGGVRVIGIPVTAVLGLLNTGLIIAHTGSIAYGIVNTVATLGVLVPFADLGMGAAVTTAVAIGSEDAERRGTALATIRAARRRLCLIAGAGLVLVWGLSLGQLWPRLLARPFSWTDNLLVGVALSLFLLTIPLGLGARTLVGLDRNHVVVAVNVTGTGWALLCTFGLSLGGAPGVAYAMSGFAGNLMSNAILAVLAYRAVRRQWPESRSAGRRSSSERSERVETPQRLLAGSGWMLVVMIGLPLGLETGRLVLAHLAPAEELSRFALGAQLYALTWSVLSTSGQALWAVFARQRGEAKANVRLWRQMVLLFGAAAVVGGACLVLLGPWLSGVISGGVLEVSRVQMAAFAGLLLVQALHLPGGVMLTRPEELRWQAWCIIAMALVSVTIGVSLAPHLGGVAITLGAAVGVLCCQFVPDLVMVPRMLERRPEVAGEVAEPAVE